MGCLNSGITRCEFTIYKDVSEHKCGKRKGKYFTFYEHKSNKIVDLNVVENPQKYKKCRIRVQAIVIVKKLYDWVSLIKKQNRNILNLEWCTITPIK